MTSLVNARVYQLGSLCVSSCPRHDNGIKIIKLNMGHNQGHTRKAKDKNKENLVH